MTDPFDLERFVAAQAPVWASVIAELDAGRKRSHWMWFVFPQLVGLGASPKAHFYAIRSIAEARAYLAHATLGPRLYEVARLAVAATGDAVAIFGVVDAMKLRSSMTLFAEVSAAPEPFIAALDRFFDGAPDPQTLKLLDRLE